MSLFLKSTFTKAAQKKHALCFSLLAFFSFCEIPSVAKTQEITPPQTQIPTRQEIPAWVRDYQLVPPESVLLQNHPLDAQAVQFAVKSLLRRQELAHYYLRQAKKFNFSLIADFDSQDARLLQFSKEKKDENEKSEEVISIEIVGLPYSAQSVARLGYSSAKHPAQNLGVGKQE